MFIPRIKLYATVSSQMPFRLICTHLPIKPAFAMTVNKAQGQIMELMGLYLPKTSLRSWHAICSTFACWL